MFTFSCVSISYVIDSFARWKSRADNLICRIMFSSRWSSCTEMRHSLSYWRQQQQQQRNEIIKKKVEKDIFCYCYCFFPLGSHNLSKREREREGVWVVFTAEFSDVEP